MYWTGGRSIARPRTDIKMIKIIYHWAGFYLVKVFCGQCRILSQFDFYRPQGKVIFSQVSVCPQSGSWLLVHCSTLLQHARYASYWNAVLFGVFFCSERNFVFYTRMKRKNCTTVSIGERNKISDRKPY